MFKLESYLSPLLLYYADKFILNLPDLKLSLWGGHIELNQLELRLDGNFLEFTICDL